MAPGAEGTDSPGTAGPRGNPAAEAEQMGTLVEGKGPAELSGSSSSLSLSLLFLRRCRNSSWH